jgi:hypothetical protein
MRDHYLRLLITRLKQCDLAHQSPLASIAAGVNEKIPCSV